MTRDREEALIYEALSQVETPEYDIQAALARERPTRPWVRSAVRRVVLLAAVCAVLAVSAGAVGASGLWSAFFGPIPSNAISTGGVSPTAGDYTLTLEDAIVDENGAMLLLALARADGGEIDPNASLRTHTLDARLLVDGDQSTAVGSSGFTDTQRSEDGKTLHFCYELKTSGLGGSLLGKTLTFTADGVGIQLVGKNGYPSMEGGAPVSLSALTEIPDCTGLNFSPRYEDLEKIFQAVEALGTSLPLPKAEEFPQFAVLGAVTTDKGLSLVLSQGMGRSNDLRCAHVQCDALVDTRDGARYGSTGSFGGELSDGTWANINFFGDCPSGAEDLPFLELEVSYWIDRLLSEKPFSLTFQPDKTSAVTLPVEEPVTISGVELHPTEIRLSALSLLVFFDDMDTAGSLYEDGSAPILTLKDGSVIETQWSGGYGGGDGRYSVRFRVEDSGQERFFFDTSQISSIRFGDLEIPIP